MIKVAKFGGSSCASAEQFRKVKDIVLSDKSRHYIVVSAPGKRASGDTKVTDLLYRLQDAVEDEKKFQETLQTIKDRYQEIIDGLGLDFSLAADFDRIEQDLKAGADRDYAASRGEFLNAKLMAAYLGFSFIDSASCFVFKEDRSCDYQKTEEGIRAALKDIDYAVFPGFYGANEKGEVVTFSRGGSDVTGSLIAAAEHVDLYENWTDVSGFLVADPRIVPNPEVIDYITYRELRELSYMGAGVLHEDAIFPVRREGIPIQIKNTNRPEDHGTLIVQNTLKKPRFIITGVSGKKDFCAVLISKDMMNAEVGFCRKVLQAFEDHGICIEHMPSGIDTMTVVVHESEFMHKEQQVVADIHRLADPDSIEIEADLALMAVVGRGMKAQRGTSGRIFSALAHAHVNVRMIDQGSSELNIIIGVENSDYEKAIRAIYSIFVETQL